MAPSSTARLAIAAGVSLVFNSSVANARDILAGITAPGIVVTASRFDDAPARLPIGVSVITAGEIADSGVTTIPELLARQPGFFVRDNIGSPNKQIDLRGFGATGDQNTLILLNGQRISENEQSSADLASIPLASIERIEILRGSGAVLYGGGATGGTINIITKTAQPGAMDGSVRATAGSYATFGLGASLRKANEHFGISVYGDHLQSDNYRRENALRQQNVGGELTWFMPKGRAWLRFAGGQQDLRLPGTVTEIQAAADPRAAGRIGENMGLDTSVVAIGALQNIAGAEFAFDGGYRERKSRSFQLGGFNDLVGRVVNVAPRVRLPYAAFGAANTLVVGADWDDWDYGNNFAAPLFASTATASQTNLAGYVQHTSELPTGTSVSIGGRQHRSTTQMRDFGVLDQERDLGAYEFALRQSLPGDFAVFAKLGQSFRMPVVDENRFLATLLEPQKSKDREIGLQWQRDRTRVRLAVFESRLTNEINFIPGNLEISGFGTNTNLPPTRRRGAELSATSPITEAVTLAGSYSWTDATFREGVFQGFEVTGNRIPLVPRHSATASVAWRIDQRWQLTTSARYTGSQPYDNDQAGGFGRLMPSYTLVDLVGSYEDGPWRFRASALNLFDERYASWGIVRIDSTTRAYDPVARVYPAAGRTMFLTAEYRFGG